MQNTAVMARRCDLKERLSRLKTVRKLIKNNGVKSQDELLSLLTAEGFVVTQATLSRDLKLLKVGKVSDGPRGCIYTLKTTGFTRRTFCAVM